jgi:NAD(P)-dependent dehydrogenase (short-subunit alcohol dehydrogenase family)
MVLVVWKVLFSYVTVTTVTGTAIPMILSILIGIAIWWIPQFSNWKYMPRQGCVLITGCDSGMGQATVVYLAKTNTNTNTSSYDQIFAACFNAKASLESFETLLTPEEMKCVTVVPLDVTSDTSVQQAISVVKDWMSTNNHKNSLSSSAGLTGVVQFHGVAFNGPAQYMPLEMYERQLQVNFVGNIRVTQAVLGLLRSSASLSANTSSCLRERAEDPAVPVRHC